MKIREYPDPVLRIESEEVTRYDKSLKNIIRQMINAMKFKEGIGLAANQIGITERIMVLDFNGKPMELINPEITGKSKEKEFQFESCLSCPDFSASMKRFIGIDVEFINVSGNKKKMHLEGILARVFQHELDHLNGILIIDYAPNRERFNYNLYITKENKYDRD